MRMKTEKVLNLEKYKLDEEDIPEEFKHLDNIISVYGNMVAPGYHFFYLTGE